MFTLNLFSPASYTRLARGLALSLSLLFAGLAHAEWYKEEQAIMGTQVSVELWHTKQRQAEKCISLVMNEMRRIDQAMSPFKEESELSQVNRAAAGKAVKVGKELFQLLQRAQQVSVLSEGQFDITFASAGRLYDYRKGIHPTDAELGPLLDAINYRHIELDEQRRTVHFRHPQVYIDLGGIAKGHAVDQAMQILRQCGVSRALVSAGGDSRILGDKQGLPWMTGIRHPREQNSFAVILPLTDTAVSTSGDYERYFIEDGTRYHHIINPQSGKPADKARSVTILGPDATTTDALSTAVFVMGPEKGMALVERLPGIESIVIDIEGKVLYSSGLLQPSQDEQGD